MASLPLDAAELLKGFGVEDSGLRKFADARVIEVCIPWTKDEAHNWPARILPWEYVIASATHNLRGGRVLTVIRHMCHPGATLPAKSENRRVLFVVSEPGLLEGKFQFDTERELVRHCLADARDENNWRELHNPTEEKLVTELQEYPPNVVHFAGFDTHQALSTLAQIEKEEGRPFREVWDCDPSKDKSKLTKDGAVKDGYVLKGATNMLNALDAEQLAKILQNENKQPPRLVVFNIYNSAARIASRAVSLGVESAIGFQDRFNDYLAERFFACFYTQLDRSEWNTAIAFCSAFEELRDLPQHQQGSGVVHWSNAPLLTVEDSQKYVRDKLEKIGKKIHEKPEVLHPDGVTPDEVGKLISWTIKPFDDINYSMLHNNVSCFAISPSCPSATATTNQFTGRSME